VNSFGKLRTGFQRRNVRNCVQCHSETKTWTQKPPRLACHDSDLANVHANRMTEDPTPEEPYKPPYPREPAE
jgi:hypothetical protein